MRRIFAIFTTLAFAMMMFYLGSVFADKSYLRNELIGLHVIAKSNDFDRRTTELCVNNTVFSSLIDSLNFAETSDNARSLILKEIPRLKRVVYDTLQATGFNDSVNISLENEFYPTTHYDTFKLPSGIYKSLRIEIGDAKGENLWSVIYPKILTHTQKNQLGFVTVYTGINCELAATIIKDKQYEIRFKLLDYLGRIEQFITKFF